MQAAGKKLWDFYKNNSTAQDAIETATWGAGAAIGQATMTDMEADEIALATAIGAASAMAARPLGRRVGVGIGTKLDNIEGLDIFEDVAHVFPVTRKGLANITKGTRNLYGSKAGKAAHEYFSAKRNQFAYNEDGSDRGDAAAILGYYLGNRADNIVQAGIGLAAPGLAAAYGGGEEA